jgi:hypothetical protein
MPKATTQPLQAAEYLWPLKHIWTGGVPADFWVKKAKVIEAFIKEKGLASMEFAVSQAKTTATTKSLLLDPGIKGGIRVAHLHFKDKIYPLNEAQWKEFSQGIITDMQAKLAKSKSIGFEEGMVLGNLAVTM